MMFQHRPVTGTCWGGYLPFALEGSKLLNKVRKGEGGKERGGECLASVFIEVVGRVSRVPQAHSLSVTLKHMSRN